jgi:hypothetical protein
LSFTAPCLSTWGEGIWVWFFFFLSYTILHEILPLPEWNVCTKVFNELKTLIWKISSVERVRLGEGRKWHTACNWQTAGFPQVFKERRREWLWQFGMQSGPSLRGQDQNGKSELHSHICFACFFRCLYALHSP